MNAEDYAEDYADDPFKSLTRMYDAAVVAKGGWSLFSLRLPSSMVPASSLLPGRPGPYPVFSTKPVEDMRYGPRRSK